MNNEIKEILEGIEVVIIQDGTLEFNVKELKILLDYITYLQEAKNILQKDVNEYYIRTTKAIELIHKAMAESDITGNGTLNLNELLNILQGDDENV